MTIVELERRVDELRAKPLVLLCRTPEGKEKAMTIRECAATGSTFVHVVCDELDALLVDFLGHEVSKKI